MTLDTEVLAAFQRLAKKANMSLPKFLELRMIDIAKSEGEIAKDYEPLGEVRGGRRNRATIGSQSSQQKQLSLS